jgi:tRNA A-37 threonylcarbamoyl transferase component Bud32
LRTDAEFNLIPARRGGVVISVGYQWANITKVQVTHWDGTSNALVNYSDNSPVIVDFSGLRVGVFAATRF